MISNSNSDSEDLNLAGERRLSKRRFIEFHDPEDKWQRFRLTNTQLIELENLWRDKLDPATGRSHSLSTKEKIRISCRLLASGSDKKLLEMLMGFIRALYPEHCTNLWTLLTASFCHQHVIDLMMMEDCHGISKCVG